jgi:hypothetical protein
MSAFPDTIYPNATTQTRLESDTADNICWNKYAPRDSPESESAPRSADILSALTRMAFVTVHSHIPLHTFAERGAAAIENGNSRVMFVVGRGKRLAAESHHAEMKALLGENPNTQAEMRKTLGDVGTYIIHWGCAAPILVMQASAVADN